MNETTQSTGGVAGFDARRLERAGAGESEASRKAREAAWALCEAAPVPHGRMEEWRRTDPSAFPWAAVTALPRLDEAPPGDDAEPWMDAFDAVVTVSDDTWTIRDVSGALREGRFRLEALARSETELHDLARDAVEMGLKSVAPDKYALLGRAFWNVGFRLAIPEGIVLERGVLFRYTLSAGGRLLIPRLLVEAGRNSRASVFERMASPDGADLMVAASRDLFVGEGGALRVITLQHLGAGARYLADDRARVARDGRLHWIGLNFGGRVCKMNFSGNVAGPGAAAELDGLYFASAEQHLDQRTLQIHSAPDTTSNLLYKGAVRDRARSIYQGLIIARPGAVRVDAYQKNNNLVLNEGARADSLPGLEIDTDDLKCSHGSTIGNLDEDQLYYLRSRGLDEAEARRTLLKGFFEEIASRIPWAYAREQVERYVEDKIG